ncbi:MAG TPA: UDP-N-acetylglucosamine 2-epimerase (non-hydrolyzing) [Gemmatimonadales bacterium]|nr:UDP-N-acetylglucosamine 2-epimerase (non-hydrolyzing) [Gemmatimonadales bacterium]
MSRSVALFFGTRPQVIKASVIRTALEGIGPVAAVDTGQHYDYALHRVHYEQLGIRPPDAYLDVGSGTHATQTAGILTSCEEWIRQHHPRGAVVIGDTNSTLACALAAAKLRVPVAHVEAGLRAADRMMAEELNRRAVDAISQVLFAPCDRVAAALEHAHPDADVEMVGDVAYDVLQGALPRTADVEQLPAYDSTWGGHFIYVTLHRAELVDSPELLRGVMQALEAGPWPSLFAVHPRTQEALVRGGYRPNGRIRLTEPVGYLESLSITRKAAAVVTDSGGLQREAFWLGVPCVTLRRETEWTETVARGANRLVWPERPEDLRDAVAEALQRRADGFVWERTDYGDGHAAERIARVIAREFKM